MDREKAAAILYRATHNIPVPVEEFFEATRWFLWYFKLRPNMQAFQQMRNWTEVMLSVYRTPYYHLDTKV